MDDPFAGTCRDDPYPIYRRTREATPVHESSLGLPAYFRYADCAALLRDNRWGRGSGIRRLRGAENRGNRRSFLRQDPPDHTRLRRLVAKAFSPQVITGLRPRIERIVNELLDQALAEVEVDLVERYAYPIPVTVICELLGVPYADHARFGVWARALARGQDPEEILTTEEIRLRNGAIQNFRGYFRDLVAERRSAPTGDDLVSRLIAVREEGDRLDDAELLATLVLLLFAGHETTSTLISNGTYLLLRHPDQLGLVRDGRVPEEASFVDELIRYDGPIQFMSRTALVDVEHAGRQYAAGDTVLLVTAAANRDPEVFAEPDRLDVARPGTRHLAFGLGIHFCLGAQLARLEGRIAIETLLRRAPELTLATDSVEYKPNMIMRGLRELPVRLR